MGCGIGLIKYLLFIFNFIFAVCGLGILSLGVVIHLRVVNLSEQLDTNLTFPSITLIVVGSIIFVISFFGCCGAIRESHCMTITFASFLLFILLVQVAVAVYAFVVVKNIEKQGNITENYRTLFPSYYAKPENREVVDLVQSTLQCCGIDSPMDFDKLGPIPWSCCNKPEGDTCSANESAQEGCVQAIKDALNTAGTILGSIAIAVAGVELIGIIFALCLANSIRNSERRGYRV
ncbi:tetraspanin 6 isoform X1 [Xylocopa sonorina]|uniref:tetraspanin 6 isoform X1 n=1 Tax=Xylocopa sonorina TaxID=1818115 RepID=UPI00403B33EA